MQEINFEDIAYLRTGNPRQREAYRVLTRGRILEILAPYDPLLAGTVPIGIDVEGSDLDIVCRARDLEAFGEFARRHFGDKEGFAVHTSSPLGVASLVVNFTERGFPVELFAQDTPTVRQPAYRHMLAEHAILQAEGEEFRRRIVALKRSGVKTEPAFGLLLGLDDPYAQLLDYSCGPTAK